MADNGSPGADGAAHGAADATAGRSSASANSRSSDRAHTLDTIAALAEWFPLCFAVYERRRKPLKLGIHLDVLAATSGAITPEELTEALWAYVGNTFYLKATIEGAARVDLQGNATGMVTADEAKGARHRLATRSKQTAPKNQPPTVRRLGLADLRVAGKARRVLP